MLEMLPLLPPKMKAELKALSPEIRARLWLDWQHVSKQRMRGARAEVPDAPTELEPTLRSMAVPTLVMFDDDDRVALIDQGME